MITTAVVSTASAQDTAGTRADTAWHRVGGERHGVSFFPRVRYDGVEYTAGDGLTFDRYHTAEVMYTWMRRWAEQHTVVPMLHSCGL